METRVHQVCTANQEKEGWDYKIFLGYVINFSLLTGYVWWEPEPVAAGREWLHEPALHYPDGRIHQNGVGGPY